jgi:hypothetical protein
VSPSSIAIVKHRCGVIGVVGLVACGSAPPKPQAPERDAPDEKSTSITAGQPIDTSSSAQVANLPAPPGGFANADLAMMIGGELSTWSVADGKLARLGSTILAKVAAGDVGESMMMRIGEGGWGDRDHLFVSIGEREVVMVTAGAVSRVVVPPKATFETPRPTGPDSGELERGNDVALTISGLEVNDQGAFWAECPWGLPYDGFQCSGWVHAQLWPTTKVTPNQPALSSRSWAWSKTPPKGFSIKAVDTSVTCSGGAVKTTIKADGDEQIEGAYWVSQDPPRLLVVYGVFGLADLIPSRWTLHTGCGTAPTATGTTVTAGPAGLWIAYQTDDYRGKGTLYRGATVIGEIPQHANVMFRPSR